MLLMCFRAVHWLILLTVTMHSLRTTSTHCSSQPIQSTTAFCKTCTVIKLQLTRLVLTLNKLQMMLPLSLTLLKVRLCQSMTWQTSTAKCRELTVPVTTSEQTLAQRPVKSMTTWRSVDLLAQLSDSVKVND